MSELFQGAELEKILKANNQVHSDSSDSNLGVQALLNYTTVSLHFPTLKVVVICDTNITVTPYACVLRDTHTYLCPGV